MGTNQNEKAGTVNDAKGKEPNHSAVTIMYVRDKYVTKANGIASDIETKATMPVKNVSNIETATIGKTSTFTITATTENSPI